MGDNHGYPNYCYNWMGKPHPLLYSEIHSGPGASAMQGTRDTYSEIGALFEEVEADIRTGLAQIGASYEGAGSEAAQSGITVLQQWTGDAQIGSNLAGDAVSSQTLAYSGARLSMPEPVEVTAQDSFFDNVSDFFGGTTPREEQEAAAREAHMEAARVMSEYDATTYNAVSAMPTWVPPPPITVEVPTPTPTTTSIDSTSTQVPQAGMATTTTPVGTAAPPQVSQPSPLPGTNVSPGPGGSGIPSPGGGGSRCSGDTPRDSRS